MSKKQDNSFETVLYDTDLVSERRQFLKTAGLGATAPGMLSKTGAPLYGEQTQKNSEVTQGADNFYKSDLVNIRKVTFKNQYTMLVAGNLVTPINLDVKELPLACHAILPMLQLLKRFGQKAVLQHASTFHQLRWWRHYV